MELIWVETTAANVCLSWDISFGLGFFFGCIFIKWSIQYSFIASVAALSNGEYMRGLATQLAYIERITDAYS